MSRGASSFARLRGDRIVEVYVLNLASLDDIAQLHAQVTAEIQRAGTRVIICSDCRYASRVSREVAHLWARSMRQSNPKVMRSGIMLDPANKIFNLQFERIVRCSINPDRRLFEHPGDLRDWVSEKLSEPERRAVRELVGKGP